MRNYSKFLYAAAALLMVGLVLFISSVVNRDSTSTHVLGDAPDFTAITDVNDKKASFFDYLTPSIAAENQRVEQEREKLIAIEKAFQADKIDGSDKKYAAKIADKYNAPLPKDGVTQIWLDEMLMKVNVLPKALVLTQAANESAWGTSRFAIEANNYFGQWCYQENCGLVPLKRVEGATHEVAKFSSVSESVHGYFMNVNRNAAYADLRKIRAQLSAQEEDLLSQATAHKLTKGLLRYSERGQDYVNDLQSMIRANAQYWK
ncbi:glucosaminidase domain-containing protein [Vibrio sp. TH_r3]|uniref:glucosaminidase domain-containing protein n=1 Tax=Vibrio sp. TH_r3 TaxID=3082084 RepID=UPI002952FF93|nr:glucosaminidase domain-containing protein [Vibrio sp. TH_r3]MDV7104345.1 glucosaminidase domain-containing protein [Vibrio sp. TH_r3]